MIFLSDMTSKIIWGPSQTLQVWSVDSDSAAEWRIRRNEHFVKMIQSRLSDKFANVVVEVVYKDGYQQADSPLQQAARSVATSGVTSEAHAQTSFPTSFAEGAGDTFKSHDQAEQTFEVVDWTTLTILPDPEQDGEAFVIANEDEVYEAMGFKEVGEIADEVAREEAAIPGILKLLEKKLLFQAFLQS